MYYSVSQQFLCARGRYTQILFRNVLQILPMFETMTYETVQVAREPQLIQT